MKATNTPASRLRKGGLRRSVVGAAAISSTGATLMTANAEIIHSGPRNLSTSTLIGDSSANPDVKPVNLDGAGVNEFSLYSFYSKGFDFHWFMEASPDFRPHTTNPIYGNSPPVRLGAGEAIGAARSFSDYNVAVFMDNEPNTQWTGGSDGFVGYRFNPSGSQNLYGWGHMRFSADAKVMTLVDWAYDNTGAPIPAGAVPEPTTSLLLAAGLTVAALWRRRVKPAAL